MITVFEHLHSLGKAEEVGGLAYLNSLAQYVPSAGNIRRYAEIVRERSILRKLVSASDEIATNAFNPQGRPVATIVDEAEQKIFNIGEQGSRMKQGFQGMDSLVVSLLDRVQEMADNPNDITDVPTGFYDLDRYLSGMQPCFPWKWAPHSWLCVSWAPSAVLIRGICVRANCRTKNGHD